MKSLAARLLSDGRVAVGRSFRLHRPRGAPCHRGWCQQCKLQLPDGRVVLACESDETEAPAHRWDALRVIGRMAEGALPWTWERHTLRDGRLQRLYLETLRRLSAALPLSRDITKETRQATQRYETDVLVVGAGRAGQAAADALKLRGIDHVIVDPESDARGNAQYGLSKAKPYRCVGLYENPRRALCIGPRDNAIVHFQRLIVATGAYDRIPTVPGNDLPGIIGLRGFETVLREAALPGNWRIGFFGHRFEARRAIEAAARGGVTLQFVAGPGELPAFSGLVFANAQLLRIAGRGRVCSIELDRGGMLECNLLIVGFSQPSYELQAQNGCSIELQGSPPVVWPISGGRAPCMAVGEAAGCYMDEGIEQRTRTRVLAWLDGEVLAPDECDNNHPDTPSHDEAFVCFCEDVRVRDVRAAIAEGYRDVELVKRHTGAGTGPCQGKLCHGALLACAHAAGLDVRIPTPRPLIRPVSVATLAGAYQFPSYPPQ